MLINLFDEIAVEEAIRLDDGLAREVVLFQHRGGVGVFRETFLGTSW